MFRSIILLCILALALLPLYASGGASGVLVLYDKDDANSITVANAYQRTRGIPDGNMLPVTFKNDYNNTTLWELVDIIHEHITAHGLIGQLQALALVGFVPLQGGKVGAGYTYSLASALYMSPNFDRTKPITGALNTAYRIPPANPTSALNMYTPVDKKSYWPVSYVGPTDRAALSPLAAIRVIERARAADGSKPGGVIYWPLNSDIRSTCREWEIARTLPVWDKMGMKYSILDGIWLKNRGDIAGGIVGIAVTDVTQGNHYLPGAWVDHLTSFGGVLHAEWQMPCSDFLQGGADGSSGTMGEPYAIAGKFPDAHIHTHLRAGASLAEAFWQSIQIPYEILPVGDPIMQPYADFPLVTVTAPAKSAKVNGVVPVTATAKATGAHKLEATRDFFIDGRKVHIGEDTETIKVTRQGDNFLLDTASISDGWHEVRVVAYNDDAIRTQGEAILGIIVTNQNQSVSMTSPGKVNYSGINNFTVKLNNLPTATEVSLRANGRTLATQAADGIIAVPGAQFPFMGSCSLYAVAKLPDGSEVRTAPLTVEGYWPPQAATVAPTLAPGTMRVRYFADTTPAAFKWEIPTATSVIDAVTLPKFTAGRGNLPGLAPDWEKVDYAKKPALELNTWLTIPENGVYEFDSAGTLILDGINLTRERNSLYGPVSLQAGWHLLSVRITLNNKEFSSELLLRGGPFGKFVDLRPSWCSALAAPDAPPAPEVKIAGVGKAEATSKDPLPANTVRMALAATSPTAGLTYTWCVVKAPPIGMNNRPDQPAEVVFKPNGTPDAVNTVATITAAGNYLLRVKADDGKSCGYADIPVKILPVATAVSLVAGKSTTIAQGYPLDCYAAVLDQFGRRMEAAQPAFVWSSTPGGNIEKLSNETVRFSTDAEPGDAVITATSGTHSGKLAVKVALNQPPVFEKELTYSLMNEKTFNLSVQVKDPEDSTGRFTKFSWTIDKQPDGQTAQIIDAGLQRTSIKLSDPGDYVVRLAVTDAGGKTTSRSITMHAVALENGKLLLPPTAVINNATGTISLSTGLYVSGYLEGAKFSWETCKDGEDTWTPLPNAGYNFYNIEKLAASDNNRLFRMKAVNAAGECLSNVAKITVKDPQGGLISLDQTRQLTVLETGESIIVTIHRMVHSTGLASIDYNTVSPAGNTAAQEGVNYQKIEGTLSWPDGDATDRTVTIPLLKKGTDHTDKYLQLILSNPKGDCLIVNGNAYITIKGVAPK